VPQDDESDVALAVAATRRTFKSGSWSRLAPRARMAMLYRFARLIEENALELGLLDSLDVGKPVVEAVTGDVPAAALTLQYFGEAIEET
jgi:gamma-glutamyl-gamma-aminobutyraldehyde dehydrogenase